MKWQNLKVKRCPRCESKLERVDGKMRMECTSCDFYITGSKLLEMISDPESGLRKYEHPEESAEIRHQFATL